MSLSSTREPAFPRLFTYRNETDDDPVRRWPNLPAIPLFWRLMGLLVLCLIPRIWMGSLVGPICHDGYYYISVASAFADGNWGEAFQYLDLNIYPVILLALNSLGMEWVFAGKFWSILISSLAVLPLFGWVRRMFSDQVAWASGFLYSLHAEFLEDSFEPIRDPTFWFLFNLCLYTTVRALQEVKYRWFLANGIVLTLAIHTRSEGWLLTIPLFCWLARQLVIRAGSRGKLLAGTALCLGVLPAAIVLVNVTLLSDQAEWQLGRLNHFAVGWNWIQERISPEDREFPEAETARMDSAPLARTETKAPASNAEPSQSDIPSAPAAAVSNSEPPPRFSSYLKKMAHTLEQINLGLLVFGLCWSGRELLNWDRGVLFGLTFALGLAIWVMYQQTGLINGRYFFPIYLTLMPYYGLGYLLVFYALWNFAEWLKQPYLKPEYTAIFLILLAIGLGWIDALFMTDHSARDREAAIGDWLNERYGPFHFVMADSDSARAAFRLDAGVPRLIPHWSLITSTDAAHPPDVLIFSCQTTPKDCLQALTAEAERLGLRPIELPAENGAQKRFLVFLPQSRQQAVSDATEAEPGRRRL